MGVGGDHFAGRATELFVLSFEAGVSILDGLGRIGYVYLGAERWLELESIKSMTWFLFL